jgi:hypothetical protein
MRPKTPGTHSSDDHSQQPREKEIPSRKERHGIAKEDHVKEREAMAEKIRDDGGPSREKSTGSR